MDICRSHISAEFICEQHIRSYVVRLKLVHSAHHELEVETKTFHDEIQQTSLYVEPNNDWNPHFYGTDGGCAKSVCNTGTGNNIAETSELLLSDVTVM